MKKKYVPKHMMNENTEDSGLPNLGSADSVENDNKHRGAGSAHPAAVPLPDSDDSAQYIPLPDGTNVAANGAIVRNPLSDQPEIEPDYEYTPEKEDLNLLIM